MRRSLFIRSFFSPLLVGLLLFATSGAALSRMTCLMSGQSVLELGLLADCCPEPPSSDVPTLSAQCCLFSEASAERTPFVPVQSFTVLLVPVVAVFSFSADVVLDQRPLLAALNNGPPPLKGAERRALSATFRI